MKKFLKIYNNLIEQDVEQNIPVDSEQAEPEEQLPAEEVIPLSPTSEVLYIKMILRALVINLQLDDQNSILKLIEINKINEVNAKEIFAKLLKIMEKYKSPADNKTYTNIDL